MSSIASFSGIASGIQWQDMIDQIMYAEQQRMLSPVQARVKTQQSRSDAWNSFQSVVSKFRSAALKLQDGSAFDALKVSDGINPATGRQIFSATASSASAAGNYRVEVMQLARAEKLGSAAIQDTSTALGLSGTFQLNGRAVTLEASDSLNSLRDKINAANSGSTPTGVTATILTTGADSHRLILTADNTGSRGIELVDSTSGVLKSSTLGILSGTQKQNTSPQDSTRTDSFRSRSSAMTLQTALGVTPPPAVTTIRVDGKVITVDFENDTLISVQNRILSAGGDAKIEEEVVGGKTMHRLSVGGRVEADPNATDPANSQRVVELMGFVQNERASQITAGTDARFQIDNYTMTRRTNTVSDAIEGVTLNLLATDNSSRTSSVTGTGLSIARDPKSIDAGTYAISLIAGKSASSSSPGLYVEGSVPSGVAAGSYAVDVTALATQATTTGSGFTGSYKQRDASGPDEITISSGGRSATVQLATGNNLATIVRNLNDAFAAQGVAMQAVDSGGQLQLKSTMDAGSSSTFTVSSSSASIQNNLGIANGTYNGTDIQGTIGGEAASGTGNVLTGTGTTLNGLQVRYTGTSTGSVGAVTVSDIAGATIAGETADWDPVTQTIRGKEGSRFAGLELSYSGSATSGKVGDLTIEGDVGVDLEITRDVDAMVKSIQALAKEYNAVREFAEKNSVQGAPLAFSGALRGAVSSLTSTLFKDVEGAPGSYDRATLVGVSLSKEGRLEVDAAKLKELITTNFNDVKALFSSAGRTSTAQLEYVYAGDETQAGTYAVNVTALATQASFTTGGTLAGAGGTYSGSHSLSINDSMSGKTVEIADLNGKTMAEIASELNDLFSGQGLRLTATEVGGQLKIDHKDYGSAASFTASGTFDTAQLDFTPGTAVAGSDIEGTINGAKATGSGRTLTSDPLEGENQDSAGLAVLYEGASTGAIGDVTYTLGLGGMFSRVADTVTREGDGLVANQTRSLSQSVETLNRRIDDIQHRLDLRRESLVRQFTAMEAAMGRMQSQGSWLAAQIQGLASWSTSE